MNILISASMKVYPQLIDLKKRLEKLGYAVELPDEGSGETGRGFKRRMIDDHLSKLRRADVLLLANVGGRIGASTFFEAGWAFVLGKTIYVLEEIDEGSDFAEDLRAIGVVELRGDLGIIKEVGL